jgi:DNA-binding NtrC family response regulator
VSAGRALRILLVSGARPSETALRVRGELQARGHDVSHVDGADQAIAQVWQRVPDVLLLDDELVDESQVRASSQVGASITSAIATLAVSALAAPEAAVVVEQAAERSRCASETARLVQLLAYCEPVEPFLTDDPVLRDTLTSLPRLAEVTTPVLFLGERGTGRETLARELHRLGPRPGAPFVVLDPARARGAAEGGVLELAEGGTLFVRGVEHLSADLQAELVRVVDRPVPAFRLLASTAADPDLETHAGQLRHELSDRLATRVRVPPLRERLGDIALLAASFADRIAGRRIAPATVVLLQKQAWPGNVRELRLVVERAALASPHDPLQPEDLQLPGEATWAAAALRLGLTLADVEREYIQAVLASHEGHRGRTAKTLGIDPKTLYNKLGTDRPRRRG